MSTQTKKCPMCAERIPLEAAVCEYCGTKFEVTVEAGQSVTRVAEEPIALPKPPMQPVPSPMPAPAPKQGSPWVWIATGLGLLLILALVGGGVMIAQNSLPFLSTPTNTPRPTFTPRPTSVPTSTPRPLATPNYAATQQTGDQLASPFVGQWSAVDPDGSHLQLTIKIDNSGVYQLFFYDDWANICDSPRGDSATGALDETNPNLLIVHWIFDCTNTGKQVTFTSKYFYDKDLDIITEVFEDNTRISWRRTE